MIPATEDSMEEGGSGIRRRRRRDGRVGLGGTLTILFLLACGYVAWTFAPHFWTFLKMKEITKSVALDWAGLNKRKATQRLTVEFRRQEIPDYLSVDDCSLIRTGDRRVVGCGWAVDVFYPYTPYYKTLVFSTHVEVDDDGVVLLEEHVPF